MVAFTDGSGNILISANDVDVHVDKLRNGNFIRSYDPNPDHQLANTYYSRYAAHLDNEGGGNFCGHKIINSPQGDGLIIYPLDLPYGEVLAAQDIDSWNKAASTAAGVPESF